MTRAKKSKPAAERLDHKSSVTVDPEPVPRGPFNGVYLAMGFVAVLAGIAPWLAESLGLVAATAPLFLAAILLFLLGLRRPRTEG